MKVTVGSNTRSTFQAATDRGTGADITVTTSSVGTAVSQSYDQANTARSTANGAYSQANSAANTVRVYANSAGALSNKFLNFVNTSSIQVTVSNPGDGNANIAFSTTGAAVSDAYNQANAAYAAANTKLSSSGGTLSGNLVITGNLEVLGNSTTLNVETLIVEDNEIILNGNVAGAPTLNAFITVNRGSSPTVNLKWNESNDKWEWTDDGSNYYTLDTALNTYSQANSARDQANTARNTANGAYGQANLAYAQANAAYDDANTRVLKSGDTMTGILNVAASIISQNIIPNLNVTYDLGNTTNRFNDLYLGGNSVYIGDAILSTNGDTVLTNTFIAEISFVSGGLNVLNQANSAYDTANSAGIDALNAYSQANNSRDQANTARDTANSAYSQANGAYGQANVAYGQANTARDQANTARTTANAAYAQANSSYLPAVTRLDVTNNGASAYRFDQYGAAVDDPTLYVRAGETLAFNLNAAGHPFAIRVSNGGANYDTGLTHVATDGTVTTGSSAQGKTSGTLYWKVPSTLGGNTYVYQCTAHAVMVGNIVIEPVSTIIYNQANAAYGQANAAYGQANTARNTANGAYGQANGSYAQANGAYEQANGAYAQANNAANTVRVSQNGSSTLSSKQLNFVNTASIQVAVTDGGEGNAVITFITTGAAVADAYGQANAAYAQANSARLQANNAYAEANLKLNLTGGTINGSLNVSGNLTITGNTSYINVTTLNVTDPLIFLASNNDTSDVVDIGFVGAKKTGNTVTHTGLARDAGDGTYYLFDNLADSGHINNVIDFANSSLAILRANIAANSITLVGEAVATHANLILAYTQANNSRDQANSARDTANGAYSQANGAYAQANGAYGQANGAYGQANGAYGQANGAYAQANSAANTVRVSANGNSTLSNKQLNFINTASISVAVESAGDGTNANISFVTTGAAVSDAYSQANSARDQANTARDQANTARDTANGAYNQANSNYISAEVEYKVYAVIAGVSAYGYVFKTNDGKVLSQWNYPDGDAYLNPVLFLRPGTTVAFKLMDDLDPGVGWNSQPFNIYNSDGSTLLTETLTHVATNGTVTTGSAAQGKTSGTLYFTIPQNRKTTNYYYNTSDFSGFNYFGGDFLVDSYAYQAEFTAEIAFDQANTARGQANTARDQANNARTTANDAYGAANSAANTARVSANSGSTLSAKQLNFNNSGSILVTIESAGDGTNANISFVTSGAIS